MFVQYRVTLLAKVVNPNEQLQQDNIGFWRHTSPPTLCSIPLSQVATLEDTALFVNNTHWHVEAVTF